MRGDDAPVALRDQAGERDAAALAAVLRARVEGTPGARLDYGTVVDFDTLQRVDRVAGTALAALAVFFGTTRLIDNVLLTAGGEPLSEPEA